MKKILLYCGLAAPVVYVLAVVLGGILWQGYSHIEQPISDLSASGSPVRSIVEPFFTVSGVLSFIFFLTAFIIFRKSDSRSVKWGFILMAAMSCLSFLWGLFPEDLKGAPQTFQGVMHLLLAGLVVPLAILGPLFTGIGFKKFTQLKPYWGYCLAVSIIITVTGLGTVFVMGAGIPVFGLVERLNIATVEQFPLVLAVILLKKDFSITLHKGLSKEL